METRNLRTRSKKRKREHPSPGESCKRMRSVLTEHKVPLHLCLSTMQGKELLVFYVDLNTSRRPEELRTLIGKAHAISDEASRCFGAEKARKYLMERLVQLICNYGTRGQSIPAQFLNELQSSDLEDFTYPIKWTPDDWGEWRAIKHSNIKLFAKPLCNIAAHYWFRTFKKFRKYARFE